MVQFIRAFDAPTHVYFVVLTPLSENLVYVIEALN